MMEVLANIQVFLNNLITRKQTWRIMKHPDCLMAKLLKRRYFPETNILNATHCKRASYIWKSIIQGQNLLKQGLRFVMSDGSKINVTLDPQLPIHPPRPPIMKDATVGNIMVCDLLNDTRTCQNRSKVEDLVVFDDIKTILSIKICSSTKTMACYLACYSSSAKSAYWLATHLQPNQFFRPPPGNDSLKQMLWKIKTSPKLKHFCWKVFLGALGTWSNLKYRYISNDAVCRRCCQGDETSNHRFFFNCEYARDMWRVFLEFQIQFCLTQMLLWRIHLG